MDTEFPSADAYADEPIRHAALEIFDVAAEQRAVTSEYCKSHVRNGGSRHGVCRLKECNGINTFAR
jgi:hypothetical protein